MEGQNHLPELAGDAALDAAQDRIGFLGWKCTLPCLDQLFIHWYHVLLCRADLNPCISQPVLVLGIAQMKGQNLTLRFRDGFSLPSICFFRMFVLNLLAAQEEELAEIPRCAVQSL